MATITVTGRRQGDPLAELDQAIEGLRTLAGVVVDAGSVAARQAILDTVSGARGSLSMSGLGATLDMTTTTSETGETGAQASLRPTPAGAWAIVDTGARVHVQRRVGRGGMPAFPYGVFSRVNHPGVAGLGVSGPARVAADAAVTDAAEIAMRALPRH